MKVEAKVLLEALTNVSGVVNDQQVAHDFRAFHFLPEEGVLKIGGSDSSTTLIEQVDYEETENSDGSKLVIPTDKIIDVVRYAGEEVELQYSEDSELVTISTPNANVNLKKHFSTFEGVIDFDLVNEDGFDDEPDSDELKTILSSLSSVVDNSETDPSYKTVFFNGEKAIVGGETTLTTADFDTNEEYTFSHKAVKQVISVITDVGEDGVKVKKIYGGDNILIHAGNKVLSVGIQDVMDPDLEILEEFSLDVGVFVSKEQLTRALNLVRATADDEKIFIDFREDEIELSSFYEQETASDRVEVKRGQIDKDIKIETLVSDVLKFVSIIDGPGVVLKVDEEAEILEITNADDTVLSAVGVRI